MKVTEVKITLTEGRNNDKLRAYAEVVIDAALVIHEIRIVERRDGTLLVCMPSRKTCDCCPACETRTPLTQNYCGECGLYLNHNRPIELDARLYHDVCHPITREARAELVGAILAAYSLALSDAELARGRQAVAC